jgi:hypothetical protein
MGSHQFNSNADEVRYFTKQLLSDFKEHSIQEIKGYVHQKSGKQFSHGTMVGAIRDLLEKNPNFENIRRGIYIQRESVSSHDEIVDGPSRTEVKSLKDSSISILNETIQALYEAAGKINILNLQQADLETTAKVKTIISNLQSAIKELE